MTAESFFRGVGGSATTRGDRNRDQTTMKTPTTLVTAALTAAILLTASLLIVTGTRGDGTSSPASNGAATAAVPK
jgi:hypothetical protein